MLYAERERGKQPSPVRRYTMNHMLHDLLHAGLGLTKLKREDIDKVFNELKSRGEVEEQDREYFITRVFERLEKTGKDLSESLSRAVNPNREKIDELNAKIDMLMKEIEALKGRKT
jgi:polyhydroxyalkanoate synthesis regulator phasin